MPGPTRRKRHPLLTTIAAAALAYTAYRLTHRSKDSDSQPRLSRLDRPTHRHRSHRPSPLPQHPNRLLRLYSHLLPTLRHLTATCTDVSSETHRLKQRRIDGGIGEGELWDRVAHGGVTRLIATVYVHTAVFLVLTVPMHVTVGDGVPNTALEMTCRSLVEGIPSLVDRVQGAVEGVLQGWNVLGGDGRNEVSAGDIADWIRSVRREVEGGGSPAVRCVVPEEDPTLEDGRSILDETYDLLESPVFRRAERECLDVAFRSLGDCGYAGLFSLEGGTKPLATVISHLRKMGVGTFYQPSSRREEMGCRGGVFGRTEEALSEDVNVYVPVWERLGSVLELRNVCFD